MTDELFAGGGSSCHVLVALVLCTGVIAGCCCGGLGPASPKVECTQGSISAAGKDTIYQFSSCADGHEREVVCTERRLDFECLCYEDGADAGWYLKLDIPSSLESADLIMSLNCDWSSGIRYVGSGTSP